MMEFLYGIDRAVFVFINQTISTPVGDFLWPLITDYDKFLPVRLLLAGVWVWLMVKGGVRGRTAALMVVLLLFVSDQIASAILKGLVARPRPCSEVGGLPIVPSVHLLVGCGPGKSFPSSHAVNNFAVATLFSYYYRRWTWAFVAAATVVAISRPAVGVHYPSDVLGGAVIGCLVAAALMWAWTLCQKRYFPSLGAGGRGEPVR